MENTSLLPQNKPSTINIQTPNATGPRPCSNTRCATCRHFNPSRQFYSTATKKCFRVRDSYTCSSKHVIYLITCTQCKKQYVGRTTKTLRERISQHKWSINKKEPRYISKHFNLPGHNLSHLKVQVIAKPETNNPEALQRQETYWIHTLKTLQPSGLNVTTDQ